MFKDIKNRITMTFVLLMLGAQIFCGAFVTLKTVGQYHKSFEKSIENTFTDDAKAKLTELANAVTVTVPSPDGSGIILNETGPQNVENIKNFILDTSLFKENPQLDLAILDGGGEIKYADMNADDFNNSRTAKQGIKGEESIENGFSDTLLEYAIPLKSGDDVRYVVYLQDKMVLGMSLVKRTALIFLISIPISLLIAFVAATLFAKSVSAPLKELTEKAKRLADGDATALSKSQGRDEIAELTNALLYLSDSRRESSEKANAEKTKIEAILQNMSDGIMAFDKDGKLTHINPEAKRLLNRKFVDDIVFNKFFKEINVDITLESIQYMPSSDEIERETTVSDHVLQFNFAPIPPNAGGGVITIIHDITRHEKLERSRRDFVANVSHELRTPITVIKSYADMLADSPDADLQLRTRFLNTISSETDRMAKIISDLLTLSSLDANTNHRRLTEDIDIRSMLEGLVERLSLTAKKKEQTLIYTPINDVPKIKGDRDALERVFTNIISNALKYTPTGGKIQVFSSKVYSDILIKVSDTGIGISKEQLPNIFERFYRVDKARSRDKGGTGLGLAIAKQTIENTFHGKILITSELNKGTDVTVSIPIPKK